MPIEIRELVIRAQVDTQCNGSESRSGAMAAPVGDSRDEMIRACVEEVLRVLDAKQER